MANRNYNNARRKESEAETIRRIVSATVDLHGQQGAMATTHAHIAELAGVSVATVYKHFPTREALIPHCTACVMQGAPAFDSNAILAEPSTPKRLHALVRSAFALHAYLDPWARWQRGDAPHLPTLAQFNAEGEAWLREQIGAVLHDIVPGLSDESLAAACVLLDYRAWQTMNEMSSSEERAMATVVLVLQHLLSHERRGK